MDFEEIQKILGEDDYQKSLVWFFLCFTLGLNAGKYFGRMIRAAKEFFLDCYDFILDCNDFVGRILKGYRERCNYIKQKEIMHDLVDRYYRPVIEKRRRGDEMKILAALMEFLSNEATICTKKLLHQLRTAATDLKIIHEVLEKRKAKIKVNVHFIDSNPR
ncbi:Oidioi.mRNA.OKI2018_I69.chr2.g5879.t1.cds [Oikopleura dioica]|uniref:Oidioi.mRNA.OKI2018_I69.chr2.g5879.t1.cds n=1 Tax=Oikopleura dioica TaxID=34765 RepID=A0ABN7T1B8_OIKDI|nr:Oidioi.mRNA.OKI2018_I69.chr2.g5879.t1.cds [Oikopleura dioica]